MWNYETNPIKDTMSPVHPSSIRITPFDSTTPIELDLQNSEEPGMFEGQGPGAYKSLMEKVEDAN